MRRYGKVGMRRTDDLDDVVAHRIKPQHVDGEMVQPVGKRQIEQAAGPLADGGGFRQAPGGLREALDLRGIASGHSVVRHSVHWIDRAAGASRVQEPDVSVPCALPVRQ